MPEGIAIEQFERRLVELGCPARRLPEGVRELGDHYLDLKEAGLGEGLSEGEAAARAAARLGDPVMLAENLIAGLRRATWWGRHPIIGFCLLPIPLYFCIWAGGLAALVGTCRLEGRIFGPAYRFDQATLAAFQSSEAVFNEIVGWLKGGLNAGSCVVVTLGFCWLARRSALGWKWMVAACVASYMASLCFWSSIEPHKLSIGLGWTFPGWGAGRNYADWSGAIPLAIGVAAFYQQRRREKRLAAIPKRLNRPRAALPIGPARWWRVCLTPTYWVVIILTALSAWGARLQLAGGARTAAHEAELKNKIWPAERAATLARLHQQQQETAPANDRPIDLKPWLNETLAAASDDEAAAKEDNLAALPTGVHVYAGVPFDVEGRIQLAGEAEPGKRYKFPTRVQNITIGSKCSRLDLLQGADGVNEPLDQKVARLSLHYRDGSGATIWIVSGEQVLDWWGPIYETDTGVERHTTSAETELAWSGSNPWIRAQEPDFSLRLYRSTFANPHPEREIASVDYISTRTEAAPFLVGLTVEQSDR